MSERMIEMRSVLGGVDIGARLPLTRQGLRAARAMIEAMTMQIDEYESDLSAAADRFADAVASY